MMGDRQALLHVARRFRDADLDTIDDADLVGYAVGARELIGKLVDELVQDPLPRPVPPSVRNTSPSEIAEYIETIEACNWSMKHAALRLGIPYNLFRHRVKRHAPREWREKMILESTKARIARGSDSLRSLHRENAA